MAKLNLDEVVNTTPETEGTAKVTFADIMAGKPQPSLRAIADIFEVPAQRIYSVAKQPVAGEIYDARVYNWGAISRFIEKRIGKDGDKFATLDEVYEAAIARDAELATVDRRHASRGAGSVKAMVELGNGKQIPARKGELAVGDTVYLKKHAETFKVVYLTESHVCLIAEGTTVLISLSNWTYNQQATDNPAEPAPETAEAPAEEIEG